MNAYEGVSQMDLTTSYSPPLCNCVTQQSASVVQAGLDQIVTVIEAQCRYLSDCELEFNANQILFQIKALYRITAMKE